MKRKHFNVVFWGQPFCSNNNSNSNNNNNNNNNNNRWPVLPFCNNLIYLHQDGLVAKTRWKAMNLTKICDNSMAKQQCWVSNNLIFLWQKSMWRNKRMSLWRSMQRQLKWPEYNLAFENFKRVDFPHKHSLSLSLSLSPSLSLSCPFLWFAVFTQRIIFQQNIKDQCIKK